MPSTRILSAATEHMHLLIYILLSFYTFYFKIINFHKKEPSKRSSSYNVINVQFIPKIDKSSDLIKLLLSLKNSSKSLSSRETLVGWYSNFCADGTILSGSYVLDFQ